jgi:hypothetical protein
MLEGIRASLDIPLTVVGTLVEGEPGADLRDAAGALVHVDSPGWTHGV